MSTCRSIIRDRRLANIARIEARLLALSAAAPDAVEGQSYKFFDGQIRVEADRANFKEVSAEERRLLAELDGLYLLVYGCAVGRMRTT